MMSQQAAARSPGVQGRKSRLSRPETVKDGDRFTPLIAPELVEGNEGVGERHTEKDEK